MTYMEYVKRREILLDKVEVDRYSDETTLEGIKEYYRWIIQEIVKT